MTLIAHAPYWKRLWSIRLAIASAVFSAAAGAWVNLPSDWQPHLPAWSKLVLAGIGVLIPSLAAAARVIKQGNLPPSTDKGTDA